MSANRPDAAPDPGSFGGHPYTSRERELGYGTDRDPRYAANPQEPRPLDADDPVWNTTTRDLIPFTEASDEQKVRHVLMAAMVLTGTVYTHEEWDEAMAALNRLARGAT